MRGDFRAILEWAGFKGDFNAWRQQSLAEKRKVHEKFARGFEAYLREGKAPNEKMKGIFAQFREWLTSIYKRLTDLKVKLTPEVRQAMGRMLSDKMPVMEPQDAARGKASAGTPQPQAANDRESARKLVESATPERIARTLDEAKEQARAFVGKPLTNRATNLKGTVSGNNLAKMTSTKAVEKSVSPTSHVLAVANADKLFENAVLDHSHADRDGEATIAAIHRYVAPMLMPDGEVWLLS
jgi:hypothetical protein